MSANTHVAMAKFRQEGVHDWQSDEGLTDATAIATALDAQIEATLAVAFEQRTANLIAIYSAEDWANQLDTTAWEAVAQQIKERLDLA